MRRTPPSEWRDHLKQNFRPEAEPTCGHECEGHTKGTCTLKLGHKGGHWFPNMWNDQ